MSTQTLSDSKWLKVIVHASGFFSSFFVSIIVPLLFYFLNDEKEIKRLSLQAVLFQLVMGILIAISAFFSAIIIGIPFLIVFVAMTIIVPIVGIVNALQGRHWEYPIIKRFF